jgi:hypothetical protein
MDVVEGLRRLLLQQLLQLLHAVGALDGSRELPASDCLHAAGDSAGCSSAGR